MTAHEDRNALPHADHAWGWDLFECRGSVDGYWQVQRIDNPEDGYEPLFESDDDAWERVGTLALDRDDMTAEAIYARHVMAFLMIHQPSEYELVLGRARL